MLEARRTRVVLIALLVVAIALITIDFRDGGNSSAASLGGRVFGPVERVAGDATGVLRGTSGNSSEIANLQRQNDQLRAQLVEGESAAQCRDVGRPGLVAHSEVPHVVMRVDAHASVSSNSGP